MSGPNQTTQLVVNYPNSNANATLDSKFQNQVPKPRPQVYGDFVRKFNDDDNNCRNVKNPWLLRIVAVFSLAVTIVIFAALHSKLRSSFYELSDEVQNLRFLLANFPEHLKKSLLVSLNHTDDNGRYPCIHFHIDEEDLKKKHKIKNPKQEASGRDNQNDSSKRNSKQAAQRKKQGTKRKISRRIAVYTRWGTTQCSTSNKSRTSLVYTGRVAAPRYTDKGGGSNYLCLPDKPLYSNQGNISEDQTAHLYPVKFGNLMKIFNKFGPLVLKGLSPELQKKFITNLNFKDVPCAVCEVEGATSVLMMPAYNYCPGRWNRQYHGYLMSQKHDYGKTEFICVDVEARGIPNTQNPNGNAFLHLTEFKCNGPSCIGYYPHKALACAVCTK